MKKLILNLGVLSVVLMLCAACGGSDKSKDSEASDSANQAVDTTAAVAKKPHIQMVDPNAPLTAEDEAKVLKILKEIHIIQHSDIPDNNLLSRYISEALIQKIKETPEKMNGMSLAICFYGGGTEDAEVNPESIKIEKFDPESGKVTYTLVAKITDEIEEETTTIHPKETATFIRENGRIVMDTTSAENILS